MRPTLVLACICALSGCASAPPTNNQILSASDVELCTAAGRAFAVNDTNSYSRVMAEIHTRAKYQSHWMGDSQCRTYAEMGQRGVQANAAERARLSAAMREVGAQLQRNHAQDGSITCVSNSMGNTTTTSCQ